MNKYQFEITIEAANETEAQSKMQSLTVLASKLKVNELARMASIIKNDPIKTALAKKYLGV